MIEVKCITCNGKGVVYEYIGPQLGRSSLDQWDEKDCGDCDGSGKVLIEDAKS